MDLESVAKFRVLMNRQEGWSKQHLARSREDIVEIDMKCGGTEKTLRDLIMEINAKDSTTPLFASIDRKWNGQGFNFSFHPNKTIEASMVLRGLFPRLAHHHGEATIQPFFTPRAVAAGRQMKYDPAKGTVTTDSDDAILQLDTIDLDMVVEKTENSMKFGERQVFEKERGEDDSVSTFQSKRAPPTEIETNKTKKPRTNKTKSTNSTNSTNEGSATSSTSSISMNTKHSFHTRISNMEDKIEGFTTNMESKVNMILQSLNINQQGQIVTPTKTTTSTDGTAPQEDSGSGDHDRSSEQG